MLQRSNNLTPFTKFVRCAALSGFALLLGSSIGQAAELTKETAQHAITQCLNGNGAPRVEAVQIGEEEHGGSAEVTVSGFKHTDTQGTTHTVNGKGVAQFIHYNDMGWFVRNFTGPNGEFVSCNVEAK